MNNNEKKLVKEFWEDESCGERYADGDTQKDYYYSQRKSRYDYHG